MLEMLLESDLYSQVTIYVRKPLGRVHPKLVEQLVNFATIESWTEADDVYCCLGATIKTVKTREAFTLIDLHAPLHIAKLQLYAGSKRLLVITAAGANPKSSVFYNRTKGKLEEALNILRKNLGIADEDTKTPVTFDSLVPAQVDLAKVVVIQLEELCKIHKIKSIMHIEFQ